MTLYKYIFQYDRYVKEPKKESLGFIITSEETQVSNKMYSLCLDTFINTLWCIKR